MSDKNLLEKIEILSRIKCSSDEKKHFIGDLEKILKFIDVMNEVETDNVPSCYSILEELQNNLIREDKASETLSKETFLSNAPDQIAGMIKVPSIMNQ